MFRRIAISLVCLLLAMPLYAALTGDIEGTVYDPSGAVIADAKVTIVNINTGARRELTTNAEGQFAALQLDLGRYRVTVEKSGMRQYSQDAVVESNQKTRLNVSMLVGQMTEVLEVAGTAPTLDVATSQVTQSFEAELVVALPNQNRDPVGFATLSPGVAPVTKDNPFLGSGSFNSNGSRGRANNITVDNAVSSDISTTGSSGLGTFSLDAVQEVKLISNNFTAEYGRNSGSQVQIITKSGTNEYHGTAYWFHQNGYFNAPDYFTADDPTTIENERKPTAIIQNLYGFTAGGPLIKNKMFLFGHYEGLKIRGAGATGSATVMTDAQVAAITDPTSRALFEANGSPSSPGGQLSAAAPNSTDAHSWSLRWDQNLRASKDTLTVRYGENPQVAVSPGLTFIDTNLPNYGASVTATDRTAFFGYTAALSPTVVNQLRFQFQRSNPNFVPFTTLTPPYTAEVQILEVDFFGVWNGIPQGRTQNVYSYGDNLSWAKGRHSFKFGTDIYRYLAPSIFDANFRGTAVFGSVADFQAGTPLQWTQRVGSSIRHNKSTDLAWFVQDDFRVTQDVTLNLGFRLESSGGVSEENEILSNLNPNLDTPLGGGGTGALGSLQLGGESFQRTWNPAPRVGLAWNPHGGKLVIRGGYGIAYDFIFLNPITNLRFAAPFVPAFTVTDFSGGNSYAALAAGTASAQTDAQAAIGTFLDTQQNFGTISPVDQNLKNPRNQQWNVGIQYELLRNFVLKTSYIGTRNDRLQVSQPLNLVQPSARPAPATSEADEAARLSELRGAFLSETGSAPVGSPLNNRLDPRFNTVNQVQSTGLSNYHALQVDLVKRMSNNFAFDVNYTWAHSIDDVSDVLGVLVNDSAGIQDPTDLRANRGNSQFDIRHRFVASYVYEIPFARHISGPLGRILNGWNLSGALDLNSGFPASILSGARRGVNDVLLVGNSTARANGDPTQFHPVPINVQDPDSPLTPFPDRCDRGVNTSTSSATLCPNISGFPLTQPLLGNAGDSGRNVLRLDSFANWDVAIFKNTKITEGTNIQFRWEVFNVLNHPNFSGFDNTLSSATFGAYTTTASNMRQMQGSLKFTF